MRNLINKIMEKTFVTSLVLAFLLTVWCEAWGRRSIIACIRFGAEHPFVFGLNAFIVFVTLVPVCLFRKRSFYFFLVTTIWIGIGLTNGIMLGFRNTPFTFVDIQLASAGLGVMKNYMSPVQVFFMFAALSITILLVIFLFFKAPKFYGKRRTKKNLIYLILMAILFLGYYKTGVYTDRIATKFHNLNLSYTEYGVPYCFAVTFLDNGIEMPLNYNARTIAKLKKKIVNAAKDTEEPEVKPNIVFLQLESFFDVQHMKELSFSKNPLPTFERLKKEYSSGFLKVPTYGAGTVNTEFEILTGMNKSFFGAGEYPFKSVLQKKTCESIPNNLKSLGYISHAIHNNTATFYDRDLVFAHMGFDNFTSSEYMNPDEITPNGWIKDSVLTGQIMDTLKSTEGQDFIYTISVQGHGEYPTTDPEETPEITVTGLEDQARLNAITYYVNEIHEMDTFIHDLTKQIDAWEEPTILVMYGDHLPSLNIESKELDNKSIYQTEYVIYSNYKLPKEDETMEAYQLSAKVLGQVNIHEGYFTKLNQNFSEDGKEYQKKLKLLQYDVLYGRDYIYNRKNPYLVTDLVMGIVPIKVSGCQQTEDGCQILGENFTASSHVYVNGHRKDTEFVDPNTLYAAKLNVKSGDSITVAQETKGRIVLSETEPYLVP